MLLTGYIKNQKKQEFNIFTMTFKHLRELIYRSNIFNLHFEEYFVINNRSLNHSAIFSNVLAKTADIKTVQDFPFHLRDELDNILIYPKQQKYVLLLKENMEKNNVCDN